MAVTVEKLFEKHPDLLKAYLPLVGKSMLELGNKVDEGMVYKEVFTAAGFYHVSVDLNAQNGAMPMDLREPIHFGTFDMVTNIGTSEHVVDKQDVVWKNIVKSTKVGGVIVCCLPCAEKDNWVGHGYWYPSHGFYEELAKNNGLTIEMLFDNGKFPKKQTVCRMKRDKEVPFVMPSLDLFTHREDGKKYVITYASEQFTI